MWKVSESGDDLTLPPSERIINNIYQQIGETSKRQPSDILAPKLYIISGFMTTPPAHLSHQVYLQIQSARNNMCYK